MGEVLAFETCNDPDVVIRRSLGVYADVIILGYDKDGCMDVRANLGLKHSDILFLIEIFKMKLLRGDYSDGN